MLKNKKSGEMEMKGMLICALSVAVTAGCAMKNDVTGDEITLVSPSGSAVVALDGGRVVSWKTADGEELFFMPAKPCSPGGDWSHGGTSLCWPWFGRKGEEQSAIHGFARNTKFSLLGRKRLPCGGESVTLGMKTRPDCGLFPHAADVELTVELADALTLKLKTSNSGSKPIELTQGFQAYFKVSGYGAVSFGGIDGKTFKAVDGMDKAFKRTGDGFGFKDAGSGREFAMKSAGNSGIVVWTPGTVEPANRNLAHDDCPKFIVIGPSCRAAEGSTVVQPGKSSELVFSMKASAAKRR